MGRHFRMADGAGQGYLMPPDARDWLPERHLAWAVLDLAAQLDLAALEGRYRADGQGSAAYHPAMMVTLIMYCYCKGIRSSRAIEMATFDDVGARVICGNLHPDHATTARFVIRHAQQLKALLPASVAACAREGLVSVDVVAGDGTKVKASASMAANVTGGELDARIAALEELIAAEVAAWVEQHLAADAADGAAPAGAGSGRPRGGRGTGRKRTAQTLARLTSARVALATRAGQAEDKQQARVVAAAQRAERKQAAAQAAEAVAAARWASYQKRAAASGPGRRPRGGVPLPPGQDRDVRRTLAAADKARRAAEAAAAAAPAAPGPGVKVNATDPASRAMRLKKGGFDQLFNLQVMAARKQVIVAIGTHDNPTDTGALHPLLRQGRAVLDAAGVPGPIGAALFDAGYASDANFTADCEPELYVAVTREARQAGRSQDGSNPAAMLPSWQQMAARLDTPAGKALYKQRAAIIEPVFAQLFNRLGRHLNYRGAMVGAELHLWAVSHNLLKAIRARQAAAARTARLATS